MERTLTCALLKALITDRMRIAVLNVRLRLIAAIAEELRIRRREIESCVRYGRDE